jgi:hypothetical protein
VPLHRGLTTIFRGRAHDARVTAGVQDEAVTRVVIDLERRENPIGGTVRAASEPARPFVGWMGLLAALEAALGTERRSGEDATVSVGVCDDVGC